MNATHRQNKYKLRLKKLTAAVRAQKPLSPRQINRLKELESLSLN